MYNHQFSTPHFRLLAALTRRDSTFKMRQTLLRAAAAMPQTGLNSSRHMALLPPIPLYRRLLRAHRKHLPHEARLMGDLYIKAEFRAHRNVDNPAHLVSHVPHHVFHRSWSLWPRGRPSEANRRRRLGFSLSGSCTLRRSKGILGGARRLTRASCPSSVVSIHRLSSMWISVDGSLTRHSRRASSAAL
jgi:hypothetical protein